MGTVYKQCICGTRLKNTNFVFLLRFSYQVIAEYMTWFSSFEEVLPLVWKASLCMVLSGLQSVRKSPTADWILDD